MVHIPPLPVQTLPGFYLRARACESKGNQSITSPSKEEKIFTPGTILPGPKVRQPRDEPGESKTLRGTQLSPQDRVGPLPEESEKHEEVPKTGEVSGGDERPGTRRKGREMERWGDEELEEGPAGGENDGRKGEGAS